jgi:hypothetical protein
MKINFRPVQCAGCLCKICMFTMPQGDSTDCMNCEVCFDGDRKKTVCNKHKSWSKGELNVHNKS